MNTKPITQIKVLVTAKAPKKRKFDGHLLILGEIDGHDPVSLDEFSQWERKAWRKIESEGYKMAGKTAALCTYQGQYDEKSDILMVKMLASQTLLIMKDN
jgi:hypothetical protein